ncbi:MAG: hypothetical protein EOL95_08360 [Bacteroidia bacterium]|nr:hypothetical protein [Bacteroidia bacterium]
MDKSTKEVWTGNRKNLSPEGQEKRKSINKKIFKFGCLPIIGLIILITLIGVFSTDDNSPEAENATNNTEFKEELPNPITSKVNLGVLKMDANGYSLGSKTELTELKRLVNIDSIDVIEIIYELQGSYGKNIGKRIVYDKREGHLKDIFTENNVIEDYKNVSVYGLRKFLENGEKGFYSLEKYTDVKYDFNNREMTIKAVGKEPEQSELDGSVKIVKDYVKNIANDASSIKFLEWSKVSPMGDFWVVRAKFKGTNALGGMVTENKWFYIQNGKVVKTKNIN